METPNEVKQRAIVRASAASIGVQRRSTMPLPMRQDNNDPMAESLVLDEEDAKVGVEEPM